MQKIDPDEVARAAARLTTKQVDLLLCMCRMSLSEIPKRGLRKRVLKDHRYKIDWPPSTFWDIHQKLRDMGFIALGRGDRQVVCVTPRGFLARDWLIEEQKLRAIRDSSDGSSGAGLPDSIQIRTPSLAKNTIARSAE